MARQSYSSRIKQRITELEREIVVRQSELDELRIAERVLGRLAPESDDFSDEAPSPHAEKQKTISAAIMDALALVGPMDTQTVYNWINNERPTTPPTVASTLTRMKASGLIEQIGKHWSLPKTNEAPADGNPQSAPLVDIFSISEVPTRRKIT